MFKKPDNTGFSGFSLSDLLIALLILGQIATFTIPKVITSTQNGRNKAIAKEAVAMVSGAYSIYLQKNSVTAGFTLNDITPYMNYVSIQTTGSIDGAQTQGSQACNSSNPCFKLHNGGTLIHFSTNFGGTGSTNAVRFRIDPDGTDSGTTTQGKAAPFFLYTTGRITDGGNIGNATYEAGGLLTPAPTFVPPWFSWD